MNRDRTAGSGPEGAAAAATDDGAGTAPTHQPGQGRALVLGGGGVTGVAWETGVLAGLAEAGVDLVSADMVVGTSAGSLVGAQILGGLSPQELYADLPQRARDREAEKMNLAFVIRFVTPLVFSLDERRGRARLGQAALAASAASESDHREVIRDLLPSQSWPDRPLLLTAVDAETGDDVVIDRHRGISLTDAVAASCAVPLIWPPVTIDGRHYIDGGVRSSANVDLAAGHDRVVVLAPLKRSLRASGRIATQIASLGPNVRSIVLTPDAASRQAIGWNLLDPAAVTATAQAGHAQGMSMAEAVRQVWCG